MVGAMAVLVLLIVGWIGFKALTTQDPDNPVRTVDYAQVVPAAKRTAPFDLVAPASLPHGWRATSVNFSDGPTAAWHLGVLTDHNRYVGLEQADRPVRKMVAEHVDEEPTRGRPVDVDGVRWSTYTDGGGDLALVRQEGRTTTLVVGHDVSKSDLVTYTASLR
jgi:hypothetical protein